jgi:hypothetical protein
MNTFIAANYATTTLASPINSSVTTLTLASAANFPSPAAGQQFAIVLNDALTGGVYEICWCTHRSGTTCTVIRGQEGTTATSWLAGDNVGNFWTAAQMTGFLQRTALSANLNLYVNGSTGSDSNSGLSSGDPFETFDKAWSVLSEDYDINGFNATIHQAGTNTDTLNANGQPIGSTSVNSISVTVGGTWTVTNGSCVIANGSTFRVNGAGTLSASGTGLAQGFAIAAFSSSQVAWQGITFGTCDVAHVAGFQGGQISASAGYTINGNAPTHVLLNYGASAQISLVTVALSGTPAFSNAFADVENCSTLNANSLATTGSATGKRYIVSKNGSIDVGGAGASALPGNVAGTASTGGQYN